jgi:hypothetical protein
MHQAHPSSREVTLNHSRLAAAIVALAVCAIPVRVDAAAAALHGSMASMQRQHEVAVMSRFGFMETPADVQQHIESGDLVQVPGGADYSLSNVSFPYAVAEVLLFIERLSAEYHAATGEQLVVTSLTRPLSLQPANAHDLSVHPAGMAVDLRVPSRASARTWLQNALLDLERVAVLDVTREHTPPHYHVAVYPAEYRAYVDSIESARAMEVAQSIDTLMITANATEPESLVTSDDAARSSASSTEPAREVPTKAPLLIGSMLASIGAVAARRRSNP